jgi:hypothetical protein
VELATLGQITGKFLTQQVSPFATRISGVVVTWSLLAVKVGTLNTHGVCTISLQAAVNPLTEPHTNKQTKRVVDILSPVNTKAKLKKFDVSVRTAQ